MRIVFMGTPEFAVPSLSLLLANAYEVVGVVTAPDKPSGRGQAVSMSAVKLFAVERKLTVLQPENLKDVEFAAHLKQLQPHVIVVVAFRILPEEVYSIPTNGAFNLHASLLPKYRGAAPINWAIMRGEPETGVTTFLLQKKVDTGGILLQARLPIKADMTAGELHDALADVGAEIVLHTVRLIEQGKARPKPQSDIEATLAPKIFKEDCRVDWKLDAPNVHNFIRGLSPRPCAFAMHRQTSLKLFRSKLSSETCTAEPGRVIEASNRLVVATGSGVIEILELQQEGKRKLPATEFLRGYHMTNEDVLL